MYVDSIMSLIKSRRSIRSYEPKEIDTKELRELVEAAIWAPSASNIQPWYFGIITSEQAKRIINFSPGLIGNPQNLIIICTDRDKAAVRGGSEYLCTMDASLAAQNIMLLAEEKGLGTCPVKSYNDRAVRKILKLPKNIVIDLIISIGYSKNKGNPPKRPNIDSVIFIDVWGGSYRNEQNGCT